MRRCASGVNGVYDGAIVCKAKAFTFRRCIMRSLITFCLVTLFLANCSSKPTASGATAGVDTAVKAGQTAATTEAETATTEVTKAAKEATAAVEGAVTCSKGKDERTLSVVKPEAGGCEVSYSKFGEAQTVASAKGDASYCESVVAKIKGNLETSGYTCQ